MEHKSIDRLIVNSPYEEPQRYWRYNRESRTFTLVEGERRPAGYVIGSEGSRAFDDPGVFVPIPLVNQIRPRIKAWRDAGYPGVTGTTKRLLDHWTNPEDFESRRFFFCQFEAIETLIWLSMRRRGYIKSATTRALEPVTLLPVSSFELTCQICRCASQRACSALSLSNLAIDSKSA